MDRTLASFAIDLNGQPTLANILGQALGEQVEVVMNTTVTTQPGTIKGTILGTEIQKVPVGTAQLECTVLNVSTTGDACSSGSRGPGSCSSTGCLPPNCPSKS